MPALAATAGATTPPIPSPPSSPSSSHLSYEDDDVNEPELVENKVAAISNRSSKTFPTTTTTTTRVKGIVIEVFHSLRETVKTTPLTAEFTKRDDSW